MSVSTVQVAAASLVIPYLLGYILSPYLLSPDTFHRRELLEVSDIEAPSISPKTISRCGTQLMKVLSADLFEGLTVTMHRNGEAEPCAQKSFSMDDFLTGLDKFENCPADFDKYDVEAYITQVMVDGFGKSCAADDIRNPSYPGFLGHCDRGPERTPPLHDKDSLKQVPARGTLPCRFHSREGLRISSLQEFASMAKKAKKSSGCSDEQTCPLAELHLYAVPAGRVFMFAPKYVGEIFELPHVPGSDDQTISLEVLSLEPRVFDIFHFFSKDESQSLVDKALRETTESHRIKRSTTGTTGNHLNKQRTSESGFDTHGKVAVTVKKRCFNLLGFDEYVDGYSDGLQILRYNLTTAYTPHLDYLDDPGRRLRHNYDSAGKGGNRFATILLYMSDLGEHDGGETVFVHGNPLDNSTISERDALAELRSSGDALHLKEGSWEEKMVAQCRSKLAIRPNSARAVLFYSQHPNGQVDNKSTHGGCPVLQGTKWAANLWVWNTIRDGFPGNPLNEKVVAKEKAQGKEPAVQPEYEQKSAKFSNSGNDPRMDDAKLYFRSADGDEFWGDMRVGAEPLKVNTYQGHVWVVKVGSEVVKVWHITTEKSYNFVI